jgi:hypothetical protein
LHHLDQVNLNDISHKNGIILAIVSKIMNVKQKKKKKRKIKYGLQCLLAWILISRTQLMFRSPPMTRWSLWFMFVTCYESINHVGSNKVKFLCVYIWTIWTLSRAMCLNVHDHKFENFVCLFHHWYGKKMYNL